MPKGKIVMSMSIPLFFDWIFTRYRKYNGAESRLGTNIADNNFEDDVQTEGEEVRCSSGVY